MAADTVCRVYQFRAANLPLVTELSLSTNTTVLYKVWEKFCKYGHLTEYSCFQGLLT